MRAGFYYNNWLYTLVGYLVELFGGKSFETLVRSLVFLTLPRTCTIEMIFNMRMNLWKIILCNATWCPSSRMDIAKRHWQWQVKETIFEPLGMSQTMFVTDPEYDQLTEAEFSQPYKENTFENRLYPVPKDAMKYIGTHNPAGTRIRLLGHQRLLSYKVPRILTYWVTRSHDYWVYRLLSSKVARLLIY